MTSVSAQANGATEQVVDHHLGAFAKGPDELLKDYDESSTIITPDKTYQGTAEIRAFFKAFIDSADPGVLAGIQDHEQKRGGRSRLPRVGSKALGDACHR